MINRGKIQSRFFLGLSRVKFEFFKCTLSGYRLRLIEIDFCELNYFYGKVEFN
jgi:hypothetical protein